jgi:hypothetical protein
MAESGAADPSDPLNSYLNPSLLPAREGVTGSYFYDELLTHIASEWKLQGVNLAGMFLRDWGSSATIALGAQLRYARLDFPEVVIADLSGTVLGRLDPRENYVGVTFGGEVRWQNGFSAGLGAAVKQWSADYGELTPGRDGKADATAFDFGGSASYTMTASSGWQTTVALGVGVINIGGDFQDPWALDEEGIQMSTPQRTNVGLSVRTAGKRKPILDTEVPEVTLTFNADWHEPDYDSEGVFRLGGEAAIYQVVFLRAGWEARERTDYSVVQAGAGLGLPSSWFVVRVDYAVYPLEYIGGRSSVEKRDDRFTILFGIPFGTN